MQNHTAVGRQHPRPFACFRASGRIDPNNRDGFANRLFHQLGWRQQIIVEILFDDPGIGGAETDRLCTDLPRDPGKVLNGSASRNIQLPDILNQRQIVIVNGNRDIALPCGLADRRGGHGRQQ